MTISEIIEVAAAMGVRLSAREAIELMDGIPEGESPADLVAKLQAEIRRWHSAAAPPDPS